MKRTLVLFALIMLVSAAFAQMKKDRTSAYNYWMKKDLVKAKEFIDKAIAYPEAVTDSKVWFYRGNIYLDIQLSPAKAVLAPDAINVAYDAYLKAKELDTKEEFKEDITARLAAIGGEFFNEGISYFQQNNFDGAIPLFDKAIKISADNHVIDTLANYGAALCLEKKASKDTAYLNQAIAKYKYLVDIKMKEASVYTSLANLYKDKGDIENASKTIEIGMAMFCTVQNSKSDNEVKIGMTKEQVIKMLGNPESINKTTTAAGTNQLLFYSGNKLNININEKGVVDYINDSDNVNASASSPCNDLLITQANIYISTNQHAKAVSSLMIAKAKEPKNVSVLYAIGVTYDLLKNDTKLPDAERAEYFTKATDGYKEAIAVDSNYFDAIFNLGAIYFNKGGEVINEANKLPISETAKYDKLLAEGNNYLNLSLPYLEKCEKIQPLDKPTLVSLKEIYTRLNKTEKLAAINAKLSTL
jgi:tetratricopeptide (TPR) repeat protein